MLTFFKNLTIALCISFLPLSLGAKNSATQTEACAVEHVQEAPQKGLVAAPFTIDTIFGPCVVDHPLVKELLQHKCMTRLKEIDQHGPSTYFQNKPTFDRYAHSVGVYALLKKCGASLEEQVAGLLHDASHTTGSHVADTLFKTGTVDAYQDGIHGWFLEKMSVHKVLKKYNLEIAHILPKQKKFTALEKDLPHMCADRIQYNLHTGLVFKRITQKELDDVVADLRFEDDTWFFTTKKSARVLGKLSLYFTEHFWGSAENTVLHYWLSSALRRAIGLELLTFDDIHFGIDDHMLTTLRKSEDEHIINMLNCLHNPQENFDVFKNTTRFDLFERPKFRGIDPLIKLNGELVHLSAHDKAFKKEYDTVKEFVRKGHKVRFASAAARAA